MKKTNKKWNWSKIIGTILFLVLLGSIVYVTVMIFTAPSTVPENEPYTKVKSDYYLSLLQCMLGLVVMFLPSFFQKKLSIEVPNYMRCMYFVFLYCAIYLGEVRDFFYLVPNWDIYLHTFSGAMLGALGFSLVSILNEEKSVPMQLSPGFVAFFAFCFALACGAVWEIYEFVVDGMLGMNMQKFATDQGVQFVGHEAIRDTMEDLMVDAAGALVICLIGALFLRRKKRETEKKLPEGTA